MACLLQLQIVLEAEDKTTERAIKRKRGPVSANHQSMQTSCPPRLLRFRLPDCYS